MYLHPRYYQKADRRPLSLSTSRHLTDCPAGFADYCKKALSGRADGSIGEVVYHAAMPDALKEALGKVYVEHEEGYAIRIDPQAVHLYATGERGLLYATVTLLQLQECGELVAGLLYDRPVCPVRGYRVFLPGRANIPTFYAMVDLLAYYKYNYIVLEIGGAMEYKRHPEINEAWLQFCHEVHSKHGRAIEIQQRTYPWAKNSIHCDNGDGGVLTQEECRNLRDYCVSRGLEVIPECPTMSHSDYICLAHRELAERQNDDYPDTYCPNHPDTYPLVFDLLEEVIEVFTPKHMHIGHDEMYSIGLCERCRDKDPVDLYVDDIKKTKAFLDERGIETWMWGEKLLDAVEDNGCACGGAGWSRPMNGGICTVPALWPCRDKLPTGLHYMHWYWRFGNHHDKVYHDRGYHMVFGNFSALSINDWKMRIRWGAQGGFVSNWGSFHEEYMQRNLQYLNLVAAAYAFWCPDFTDKKPEKYHPLALRECNRLYRRNIKHPLTVVHATTGRMAYKTFYDGVFIEDEVYNIGRYELTYADGTIAYLPVRYGTNITCAQIDNPYASTAFREVSYTTMPERHGAQLYYACAYENPHPDKQISGFRYLPYAGKEDFPVLIQRVDFGTPGSSSVETDKTVIDAGEFTIE